jgi:hypothetical protein
VGWAARVDAAAGTVCPLGRAGVIRAATCAGVGTGTGTGASAGRTGSVGGVGWVGVSMVDGAAGAGRVTVGAGAVSTVDGWLWWWVALSLRIRARMCTARPATVGGRAPTSAARTTRHHWSVVDMVNSR